jgi:galactokinase/mevalonate kinase-like predicted kinase
VGLTVQASAPGRAGILGNPSDIYGGTVLACSIPARATCRLEVSDSEQLPEDTRLWDAATARFPLRGPVKVTWHTDIPRSSGLSGSTALLAATLACVLKRAGHDLDLASPDARSAFAELVRDVERHEADIMCGYQDAYMIVHGGINLMNFAGKHPRHPGPPANLQSIDAPLPFLLVTTGVERLSGAVHGPMSERWLAGDQEVIAAIERIGQLAEPGAHALQNQDFAALAELMTENQRLIASVGGSGDPVEQLIARCLVHGAMAAKLAGAGMGGTVIALTDDPANLEAKLRADGYARFLRPARAQGVRYEPDHNQP